MRQLLALFCALGAAAATYEVGPGQRLEKIEEVPWSKLQAGDHVLIHWRPEAYHVRWIISVRGTAEEPVIIRGVPGPKGELPVISGEDAVLPPLIDYWGSPRGIIKIGAGNVPKDIVPSWVIVENLEVCHARPGFKYFGRQTRGGFGPSAAPIWIEAGDHITIRHCTFHDGANGLFVSKGGREILIESCHFYDNGIVGKDKQHNIYTEANGITFQFNRMEPLRAGALGNNLKDRSAGTVIRYNWIEGGNREIDLVDAEDSSAIRSDPKYGASYVYGNVIIEPDNPRDEGQQIIHYGGDSGHEDWYRKGVLYFFNNTIISRRRGNTTLLRVQTNREKVDCRNNIVYLTEPGNHLAIVDSVGQVELTHNWLKKGWVKCHEQLTGAIHETGNLNGDAPGFVAAEKDDFHLAPHSPCIGAGASLPASLLSAAPDPAGRARSSPIDLGAFGFKNTWQASGAVEESAGAERKH